MGHEIKFEQTVTPEELKALLIRLADALTDTGAESGAGSITDLTGLPLAAANKLKIGIKRVGQGFECKVKAKAAASAADLADMDLPADAAGKPKYKGLKKRMKATFKEITRALLAGEMPAEAVAASFVEDARLMVTYPGKGDEFYPAFSQAVDGFAKALEAGDLEALRKAALDLDQRKSECHD